MKRKHRVMVEITFDAPVSARRAAARVAHRLAAWTEKVVTKDRERAIRAERRKWEGKR